MTFFYCKTARNTKSSDMNTNLQWYRPKKKNINFIDGDLSKI